MSYIKRDMEELVRGLTQEYACILVTGPRQVGKSTMLEHLDGDRSKVTLDDLQERALARQDPEMFLKLHKPPVLIDEVQYAPELFSYLKIAIDRGAAPGSYWLTGSQSYKLMSLAQESLAGRIAILNLTSLSQHELYGSGELLPFDVNLDVLQARALGIPVDVDEIFDRIWAGGLPGLASGKYLNRDIYYSSYLQTYLSRDVKEEISVKDDAKFIDFIRAAACRVGQELNVHSIALDVDVSDDTAKRWLGMLEKSQVIFYLHPYSNNLLKRVVKTPKLYFFDTGLVSYLTKYSNPEILLNGSINGAILENYVVAEIRKSYLNCGKELFMYYYRDVQQQEIDLILESNGQLHPIEIKKSSNPTMSMVKSFDVLKKASLPVGQGAIICIKDQLTALDKDTLVVPIWAL
ncbi:MAG: ATP-binding protein [Clostridia bacterium]|nr:ATP-binding protein [Clostridia bacterium]